MFVNREVHGYLFLEVISSGASANVYKAKNNKYENMMFAVKVISTNFKNAGTLYHNEVDSLKCLDFTGIIKMYDHFLEGDHFFIVMEYVENSLKNVVITNNNNETLKTNLFHQILRAVSYLHAHGIAHHDIKPENILVNSNGMIKLIDFGICINTNKLKNTQKQENNDNLNDYKSIFPSLFQSSQIFTHKSPDDNESSRKVQFMSKKNNNNINNSKNNKEEEEEILVRIYSGSPAYCSPEILNKVPFNPFKSDVWAVGVLLSQIMDNYLLPWRTTDFEDMIECIKSGIYAMPYGINPVLSKIIRKMLSLSPNLRATIDEALSMLETDNSTMGASSTTSIKNIKTSASGPINYQNKPPLLHHSPLAFQSGQSPAILIGPLTMRGRKKNLIIPKQYSCRIVV